MDETGQACLADFGLLTIISDSENGLSSTSGSQGGTVRWMSPELIDPERFGFERVRPTKSSDCYALGMVMFETISEKLPFDGRTGFAVLLKVVNGERPRREAKFEESLWKMLGLCWSARPSDRPSVEEVLDCLEITSNLQELTAQVGVAF